MMQEVAVGETIIYTYDVAWKESETHWASRWDVYLTMNHAVKNRVRFVFNDAGCYGDIIVLPLSLKTYSRPCRAYDSRSRVVQSGPGAALREAHPCSRYNIFPRAPMPPCLVVV